MGFYIALLYAGYGAETVVPLFMIGFCHLGLVGFGIGYFRRRFLVFHIKRRENEDGFYYSDRNL